MRNATEKFEHHGVTVEIHQDEDAHSPQENGDEGLFLVSGHDQFYVMPPGEKGRLDWDEVKERYQKTHWCFSIEAYIHSGVHLSMSHQGNYPDRRWDVSQVGAIFAAKKEWRLSKSAEKSARSYLNAWNQYLSGDVWGYIVGEDTPFGESCWGFYGLEYCKTEARSMAEHVAKRIQKEKGEELRAACSDIVTV